MASYYINALDELKDRNSNEEYVVALRILQVIADNILKDPSHSKYRALRKNNSIMSTKVLNLIGGKECLIIMGFEEVNKQI